MAAPRSINHRILHDMLCLPTAPFAEHFVADYVRRFCKRRAIGVKADRVGNILIRVHQGKRRVARPVCLTAHLDHPGFVADRMVTKGRLRAFWRGGVPPEYFRGARVRFFVENQWIKGRIHSIKTVHRNNQVRVDTAEVDIPREVPTGSIGMWDFPDPTIRGTRIFARGCDDIAGAGAILCCIDELVRRRTTCDAYFLFTRAEEVGFLGAIAAARLRTIPKKCFVVSMETSSERPHAKMGDGPILRVGDRASCFTPHATAYCHRIARELSQADRQFQYQRKLMDGGTCESSAFCALGYEATGLCVALGNYHNVDVKRKRLAPEYIDLGDFDNMIKWFVELARSPHPLTGRDEGLHQQLKDLEKTYGRLLRSTVKP